MQRRLIPEVYFITNEREWTYNDSKRWTKRAGERINNVSALLRCGRRKWYNFMIPFERISRLYFLRSTVTSWSIHLLETGSWAGLVNSIGFRDRIPRNDRRCSDLFFHAKISSSRLSSSSFISFFFSHDFKKKKKKTNYDKRAARYCSTVKHA